MKIKRLEVVEEFGKKKLTGNAISLNFNGSEIAVMANTIEELQRIGRELFDDDFVVDESLIVKCELARCKEYEMSLTQETVTVYVDDVAFEVDYQFDNNYPPGHESSNFVIVGIAGYDEETGECEDFTKFLNCGKSTSFYQSLLENTLMMADSEWQESSYEILCANEFDNRRW